MELPSNPDLIAYGDAVRWDIVEQKRRAFNREVDAQRSAGRQTADLDAFSEAVGGTVRLVYDDPTQLGGNVFVTDIGGYPVVLGSVVSERYRSYDVLQSIVPYNMNASVNHTNIHQTEDSLTRLRVLGAEVELGLVHPDGAPPSEEDVQGFMRAYYNHALQIGIYPKLDREACAYQVEAHVAPSLGYQKTRNALNGMLNALVSATLDTGLRTLVFSVYPTETDFAMTDHPKVQTAVDLMLQVNGMFPEYTERLSRAQARYGVDPATSHHVKMFRNQGCHIHIDLAGRSEALGMLTFHTVLKSMTAIANATVLKGCPFVNGTCDTELLCAREYLRSTTVTGRYLDIPLSPHLSPNGLHEYAELLRMERANATGRAIMYNDDMGEKISVMHNPIGRLRPDLGSAKRVCTVESTGMPTNISASRMAAVLVDFEFSHVVIEAYFRKYGVDLDPMREDTVLWDVMGPLDLTAFAALQDAGDRVGTDLTLRLHSGREVTLAEFYEIKRRLMHRVLEDVEEILPRDIDEVYMSLQRMLEPPSGHSAQTIEHYLIDPKLRSTGNWGRILRDAYLEAGGVVGAHCPDAVMAVVNRVHDAMSQRFFQD